MTDRKTLQLPDPSAAVEAQKLLAISLEGSVG